MADVVFATLRRRVEELKAEARQRRKVTPDDAAADGMDYTADEVLVTLEECERASRELTVAEYARLHRVGRQTVRDWIRAGKLAARETARGEYLIPRAARPPKPARARLQVAS